jgi:hypothetical protein
VLAGQFDQIRDPPGQEPQLGMLTVHGCSFVAAFDPFGNDLDPPVGVAR